MRVKSIPLSPGNKEKPKRRVPKLNPRDWFFKYTFIMEICSAHEKKSVLTFLSQNTWKGDWQLVSRPFYYPVITFRFMNLKIRFTRREDAVRFKLVEDSFREFENGNRRISG